MGKRLRKLFGTYSIEKILIIPYRSYGTQFHMYVKGRVLDNDLPETTQKQTFVQTIRHAIHQFNTHEIPNCKVVVEIGGIELHAVTDKKGYFLIDAVLPADISMLTDNEGWMKYSLVIVGHGATTASFTGEFLIPEKDADFGVISDIDDTILDTGVTSFLKWKVLRNSLFVSAYRRIPLAGAPEFYRKLHFGIDKKEKNPIFYLSNSPWNMYHYLSLFLDHNGFPKGAVLLRSFNSIFQRATGAEKPHKQKEILNLLETYPEFKFILIGDSGEHDATIYTDIAAQFPNRILCIYLRSVNHKRRMRHVKSIVDNFRITPVLLVENSKDAEIHAMAQGYF
jgi:phosphatidate phosphatase APP1